MSLSKPREGGVRNPAVKFISWKGGDDQGWFEYYDKETKKNIKVDFIKNGLFILDKDLFSIRGWNNTEEFSVISNEVRTVDDVLVVKAYKDKKSKVILQGPYSSLKDAIKGRNDCKYTRCVYAMFMGELVHLSLSGVAFAAFLENVEAYPTSMQESWVYMKGVEQGKKGNVKFMKPVFGFGEKISSSEYDQAYKMDSEILQPYLEAYFGKAMSPSDQSEQQDIDVSKWRGVDTPNGKKLCELEYSELEELNEMIIEEGGDSPLFPFVSKALSDHQLAANTWKDKKDSKSRSLGDYTYEEMKPLHDSVPRNNVHFIFIDAAMRELKPVTTVNKADQWESEYDDDDDIPF